MALIIADRVKEVTATTGTGALTVSGTFDGFRAFSAVCGTSDTFYYSVQAVNASGQPTGEWETGLGTYTGANTIARTSVLSSSNGGSAVDFSAGDKHIWIDFVAAEYRTIRPIYDSYTITVGATGYDYTTVSAAINSLSGRTIMPSATVTIEIQDEAVVESAEVSINHPSGDRISIVGKTTVSTTVTSVQSTSGSLGAYSFVLNVGSVANLAVGDYALIFSSSGGTNPHAVEGCWAISNVDAINTRITVATTNRKADLPSGAVAASILVPKSRVSFLAAGSSGVIGAYTGEGPTLSKLVVVGDPAAGSGVLGLSGYLRTASGTSRVGVSGFYRCVETNGTKITVTAAIVSAAANRGFSSLNNGSLIAGSSVASGIGQYGYAATTGSYLNANSSKAIANSADGYRAYIGSAFITCDSAQALSNANWGFVALAMSRVYAVSSVATSNTSGAYSPAVNTVGNDNSYIDT